VIFGRPTFAYGALAPAVVRPSPPNPLWVDVEGGSAGGTGAQNSPLNSLTAAMVLCAGLPDYVIRLKNSAALRQEVIYFSDKNLTIEPWPDEAPWSLFGSDILTGWTNFSGEIWRVALTISVEPYVVVYGLTETIGDRDWAARLIPNLSTPTALERGQSGRSGGFLYVRMPDGSDPNNHVLEVTRRNTGFWTYGAGKLTLKGGELKHFILTGVLNGLSTVPAGFGKLECRDMLFEFGGTSGAVTASGNNELTEIYNCEAFRSVNDGWNHRVTVQFPPLEGPEFPDAGAGIMNVYGGKSSYHGDVAGQSSQGASPHARCVLNIYGGEYKWSVSGGIGGIDEAEQNLIGDSAYGPVYIENNMREGNTAGTIANQAGLFWLDQMTGDVRGPVYVRNNGGVGVRKAAGATVTGLGNLISTGNALADVIA
jgi:hypothetical protein